jgi:hypothetical protein
VYSGDDHLRSLASQLRAELRDPHGTAVECEAGAGRVTQMGLDQAR